MRQYSNFNEIERDLKLLKLQSDVDKERVFLSYNHTRESLSPMKIIKRGARSVFKTALIYKGVGKLLGFIGDTLHRK